MYSKVRIAGHPVHPMLVAYPIVGYTITLVGFAVFAAGGGLFWLRLAIALNIVGAGMAILAALAGVVDWAFGIPTGSSAKTVGLVHAGLNVAALGLFLASVLSYVWYWNGPITVDATLGLALSAAGLALTLASGFLGWMLVQDYHIGIHLTARQQSDETAVQATTLLSHRHGIAK